MTLRRRSRLDSRSGSTAPTKTNLFVGVNGILVFGAAGATNYANVDIPSNRPPDNLIAAFWDDLTLVPTQRVVRAVLGSEPYRRLVVQYCGAAHYSDPGARYTFQVILFETWNEIRFQYKQMNSSPGFYFGDGRSATVGIEDAGGTNGIEWSHNRVRSVTNSLAVAFWPTVQADLRVSKTGIARPGLRRRDRGLSPRRLQCRARPRDGGPPCRRASRGRPFVSASNSQGTWAYAGGVVTSYLGTVEDGDGPKSGSASCRPPAA